MKRKLRSIAILLAAVLMFNDSGLAYASSVTCEPEGITCEQSDEDIIADENESEEETSEDIADDSSVSDGDSNVEESTPEETGTDEKVEETEGTDVPEESESTEPVTEADVSANDMETDAVEESGDSSFKGMELSEEMLAQKAEIAMVVAEIENAVPGEDYIDGSLLFFADSEQQAKAIADSYNEDEFFWQNGIGMIQVPYSTLNVLKEAADMSNSLPAVYPNIIYKATGVTGQSVTAVQSSEKVQISDAGVSDVPIGNDVSDSAVTASAVNYGDDADFGKQWHHGLIGDTDAWAAGITGAGVKVAVIDSGIDSDHSDLKANIKGVYSTVYKTNAIGYPVDDNGNPVQYVSDLVFLSGEDENGHGTHVAGIIAAADNTIGGVGVAPNADIYSIRALNAKGSGSSLMIALALQRALELDVDVVNMSLGSHTYDYLEAPIVQQLISKGIVVVAAAGNEGYELGDQKSYPAAYPSVISVGATYSVNGETGLSWFSTYGKWVTIAAPGGYCGGNIYDFVVTNSGKYDERDIYSTYLDGQYTYMAGTSQASPVTAGTVALVIEARRDELARLSGKKKVDKVKNILLAAEKKEEYYSGESDGRVYGGLNARDAVLSNVALTAPVFTPSKLIDGSNTRQPVIAAGEDEFVTITASNPNAWMAVTTNGKTPSDKSYQYEGTGSVNIPLNKTGALTIKVLIKFGDKKLSATQKYKLVAEAKSILPKNGNQQNIVIGSSVKMDVDFEPVYTTDKKMEWESSDKVNFPVDKNGKVKCNKNTEAGTKATITGTLKADPEKKVVIEVTAIEKGQVDLVLANAAETLKLTSAVTQQGLPKTYSLSNDVTATNCEVSYTSSNTKVAKVDYKTGVITAVGKGSCKITVTALDGSKKKAVKKVTVTNPVAYLQILNSLTGDYAVGFSVGAIEEWQTMQVDIAQGCKIPLKTVVVGNGTGASNKKVNWTTDNEKVKVAGGKLVCDKNAAETEDYAITVTGTAADGSGAKVQLKVRVYSKTAKIGWGSGNAAKTSNSLTLGLGESKRYERPSVFYSITGEDVCTRLSMKFSNPDICYLEAVGRDQNGNLIYDIVGAKKGKCTITYKAIDGSNKTAKYVITVK